MRRWIAALSVTGAALGLTASASAATQRAYPALPAGVAHKGSAIVAFNTPVQAANGRFVSSQASAADLNALNATLASIGATSVGHLFTNLPADELQAARAQAEQAEGRAVTDFTQVYQVTYNPAVNAGTAANDLAKSKLVSSAMPDWIFIKPADP